MSDSTAQEQPQGERDPNWQPRDTITGAARVFAAAELRVRRAVLLCAAWSLLLPLCGALDLAGATTAMPTVWSLVAGPVALVLAVIGGSRSVAAFAAVAGIAVLDVAIVAWCVPNAVREGHYVDLLFAVVRIAAAPFGMHSALNGYLGAADYQAFKHGYDINADWRNRLNARMLTIVTIGGCAGALILGMSLWSAAVYAGFLQPGYLLPDTGGIFAALLDGGSQRSSDASQEIERRRKKVQEMAAATGVKGGERLPGPDEKKEVPESAKPIRDLDGLDPVTRSTALAAQRFALGKSTAACLLEALRRQGRCRSDGCHAQANVFLRACLPMAAAETSQCGGVPSPVAEPEGAEWAEVRCVGRLFEPCRELLYALQGHCHLDESGNLQ